LPAVQVPVHTALPPADPNEPFDSAPPEEVEDQFFTSQEQTRDEFGLQEEAPPRRGWLIPGVLAVGVAAMLAGAGVLAAGAIKEGRAAQTRVDAPSPAVAKAEPKPMEEIRIEPMKVEAAVAVEPARAEPPKVDPAPPTEIAVAPKVEPAKAIEPSKPEVPGPPNTVPRGESPRPEPKTEKAITVAVVAPAKVDPPRAVEPDADFQRMLREGKNATRGERYKTAAANYRKALALKPESTEAKAGLGIAIVMGNEEGAYREAVRLLSEAVKAQDSNARAWLALGMAFEFTNQKSAAVAPYKKYLLLEPTGESANDVRAMLKELGQ